MEYIGFHCLNVYSITQEQNPKALHCSPSQLLTNPPQHLHPDNCSINTVPKYSSTKTLNPIAENQEMILAWFESSVGIGTECFSKMNSYAFTLNQNPCFMKQASGSKQTPSLSMCGHVSLQYPMSVSTACDYSTINLCILFLQFIK